MESKPIPKTPKESKIKETTKSSVENKDSKTKEEDNQKKSAEVMGSKDPLQDEERLKLLKRIISHLCLLVLILAINQIILGLCAYAFYAGKTHLVIFGGLAIMQLISAPIGWYAIKCGNRVLFLICSIINFVWIFSAIICLLYYWLFNRTDQFNHEIALHVGAVIFLTASISLAICCILMMKQIDMIAIAYKEPKVVVVTDGKASDKMDKK